MLGVACHDSHSGIDRVHTHTDHIWIMWWFHHLDPLGRSGHGEDIDHVIYIVMSSLLLMTNFLLLLVTITTCLLLSNK